MTNLLFAFLFANRVGANASRGLIHSLCAKQFTVDEFISSNEEIQKSIKSISPVGFDYIEKEILIPYMEKLSAYVTPEELKLATHRIRDLTVKRGWFSLTAGGYYQIRKNLLKYYEKKSLGHEFLHMASSYTDKEKDIDISGFHFTKKRFSIGRGINEGYTELLASRIYNKKNKVSSYQNLVPIVEMIELFFDDAIDMRKLYFSGNLAGVIHKLQEYGIAENEIYCMLFEMDAMALSLSPSLSKTRLIQEKLYHAFMEKCQDEDRIAKMNALVKKDKILSYKIRNSKRNNNLVPNISIQQFISKKAKKYYIKAGAYVAAYFLALNMGPSIEQNFILPAVENILEATGIDTISTMKAESLIENNLSDANAFLLDEQKYLLVNGEPISSYDGKRLYKVLLDKNIQYCEILDEYYTPEGGDILFNTYCGTTTHYVGDAEPIYQGDEIFTYAFFPPEDSPSDWIYTVKEGKVYCTITDYFVEVTCPNGIILCESDFPETYDSVALIDSKTVSSKPYDDIIDKTLLCNVTESSTSQGEEREEEVTYTLVRK